VPRQPPEREQVRRVPLVVKLTTDPAFARVRSLGIFSGDIAAFQRPHPAIAIRYLKSVRRQMLSHALKVVVPSWFLAEIAHGV
jgi:hypothetical protein